MPRRARAGWRPIPTAAAVILVALGFALTLAAVAPGGVAAQRSVVIEDFHSRMEVRTDGSLVITETLRPRFTGSWRGLQRDLSLRNLTAAGDPVIMDMAVLSASADGAPARYDTEALDRATRRVRVWVPDAEDRTAEVEIQYRIEDGAIRYFAADTAAGGIRRPYDELYLQVTGTEWEVPIQRASAEIHLPDAVVPIQAAAYFGSPRSSDRVDIRLAGGGGAGAPGAPGAAGPDAVIPPVGPIPPGNGLTVAVGFEAGAVAMSPGITRAPPTQLGGVAPPGGPAGSASPLAFLPLLLPFLVFWLAYRAWDERGRDPKGRAITVHWEPPEDLSPGEAGTLVDHRPDMHDVISILVDLAVRGYVVIEEREGSGLFGLGKDYAFHLMRPRQEWDDLADHEADFLHALFKFSSSDALAVMRGKGGMLGGIVDAIAGESADESAPPGAVDSVLLSDLKNKFYKELPEIRNGLLDAMVEKGHYRRRPDRVRGMWLGLAGGAAALGFLGMFAVGTGTMTGVVLAGALVVAGVASALILGVFAFLMPARTRKGARTREAALGFKQFLERVESPRYKRMIQSPDQFEAFLPYAMAFKCEEKWAAAFDDLLTEPPDWYHGRHGVFQPTVFASDLGGMASTASSSMSSSPGSSSGSGGGGSVGGGGGGGGGGGF